MNAPSLWREVGVGLALSVAGALAFHGLRLLMPATEALKVVLVLVASGYLLALMQGLAVHIGRVIAPLSLLVLVITLAVLNPPVAWVAMALTGFVWLTRSLYRYARPSEALADAGLCLLALCAALAALQHSHSLFLALWSSFLLHALHVWIPTHRESAGVAPIANADDAFTQASRSAENALRRLATRS